MSFSGDRLQNAPSGVGFGAKLALFLVNFYILYVIYTNEFYLTLSIIGLVIGAILLLTKFKIPKSNPVKSTTSDLWKTVKYFKITRFFVLIGLVGLVISVLIITQSYFVSDSAQNVFFSKSIGSTSDLNTFRVTVNTPNIGDLKANLSGDFQNMMKGTVFEKSSIEYYSKLRYSFFDNFTLKNGIKKLRSFQIVQLDNFTYPKIKLSNQSIPVSFKNNVILASIERWGNSTPVSVEVNPSKSFPSNNSSSIIIRINDTIPLNFNTFRDILSNISPGGFESSVPYNNYLFLSPDLFSSMLNSTSNTIRNPVENIVLINTPVKDLFRDSISTSTTQASEVYRQLSDYVFAKFGFDARVSNKFAQTLDNINTRFEAFKFVALFIIVPVIVFSIALLFFVSSLIEGRIKSIVSILKVRGAGSGQIQTYILFEILLSGLVSVIFALIISYFWLQYMFQSLFQVSFQTYNFPLSKIPQFILVGIILSLDSNFSTLLELSHTEVISGFNPVEKKAPLWSRAYLDVITFAIGIVTYFIYKNSIVQFQGGFLVLVFVLLGIIGTIGIFIGASLTLGRLFIPIVERISRFFWNTNQGLLALGSRNISINKNLSRRVFVLILFGLILAFTFQIIPSSLQQANTIQAYYNTGADVRFTVSALGVNETQLSNALSNMSTVQSYTSVYSLQVYSGQFGGYFFDVLGLNTSNFAKAAFWESRYAATSLTGLINKLKPNNTIIGQRERLQSSGFNLNGNISISVGDFQGLSRSDPLKIVDEFNYFPNLYKYSFSRSIPIAMSLHTMHLLVNKINQSTGLPTKYIYAKFNPGFNLSTFENQLASTLNLTLADVQDLVSTQIIQLGDIRFRPSLFSFERQLIDVIFEIASQLTIIGLIYTVVYYLTITMVNRRQEIGILRAIGMVKSQITKVLIIESMLIGLVSAIVGFALSVFVADFMFNVLFSIGGPASRSIPPLNLVINQINLMILSGVYLVVVLIASVIPAIYLAGQQTSSILRAE